MDGWTDGRTDGRINGRMDGRTDGWIPGVMHDISEFIYLRPLPCRVIFLAFDRWISVAAVF